MRKYELGHMELVNSQVGKKTCYCLLHPVLRRRAPLQNSDYIWWKCQVTMALKTNINTASNSRTSTKKVGFKSFFTLGQHSQAVARNTTNIIIG
jgi:hypothetical protein